MCVGCTRTQSHVVVRAALCRRVAPLRDGSMFDHPWHVGARTGSSEMRLPWWRHPRRSHIVPPRRLLLRLRPAAINMKIPRRITRKRCRQSGMCCTGRTLVFSSIARQTFEHTGIVHIQHRACSIHVACQEQGRMARAQTCTAIHVLMSLSAAVLATDASTLCHRSRSRWRRRGRRRSLLLVRASCRSRVRKPRS